MPSFVQHLWKWTGIAEKNLFDWGQLVASVTIPVFLAILTYQQVRSAEDNQRYEMVSKYIDQMAQSMLDGKLRESEADSVISSTARTRTLNALRQLDSEDNSKQNNERKGQLLKFLYEAELIGQCQADPATFKIEDCRQAILDLRGAHFNGVQVDHTTPLRGVNLAEASFKQAQLSKLDLRAANLKSANLKSAHLSETLLDEAQLDGANLEAASLIGAKLSRTRLMGALLKSANLSDAKLFSAALDGADLTAANLSHANLEEAKLWKTNLTQASLRSVNLKNANLRGANLKGADLTGANLEGADFQAALYDSETRFPLGFNPEQQGMFPG